MAIFGYSARKDNSPLPLLIGIILAIANLAVFWFELYKILVFANFGITLILLGSEILMPSARRRNWAVTISFVVLYGYLLLASTWAPLPSEALENAGRTLASALPAFFAGEYLARRYALHRLLEALCSMSLILLPQLIYNSFEASDPSLIGMFSIRTIVGIMLAVIIPLCAGMYLQSRRSIYIVAGVASFSAVIIMQSRAGILIAPVTTLIILYTYSKRFTRNLLIFGAAPLLLIGSLTMSVDFGRFSGVDTSVSVDENVFAEFAIDRSLRVDFERRLHTYMAGRMIADTPVFGGGYSSMLQNNRFNFGIELTAHGYPGFLAELGMAGALLFCIFLYFGLRDFLRSARSNPSGKLSICDRTFLAGFIAILLAGFFHQQLESAFFGLLAGMLAGLGSPLKSRATGTLPRSQAVMAI